MRMYKNWCGLRGYSSGYHIARGNKNVRSLYEAIRAMDWHQLEEHIDLDRDVWRNGMDRQHSAIVSHITLIWILGVLSTPTYGNKKVYTFTP